jgi:hypothetical protein
MTHGMQRSLNDRINHAGPGAFFAPNRKKLRLCGGSDAKQGLRPCAAPDSHLRWPRPSRSKSATPLGAICDPLRTNRQHPRRGEHNPSTASGSTQHRPRGRDPRCGKEPHRGHPLRRSRSPRRGQPRHQSLSPRQDQPRHRSPSHAKGNPCAKGTLPWSLSTYRGLPLHWNLTLVPRAPPTPQPVPVPRPAPLRSLSPRQDQPRHRNLSPRRGSKLDPQNSVTAKSKQSKKFSCKLFKI